MVSVNEEGDEVFLAGLFFLLSFVHRLFEGGVGLVVGQCFDNIGHAHFEDDVHTSLKVKTEANLCLQTFLVRVDAKVLHRVFVVLLCDGVLNLCCLSVIVACSC